MPRPQGSRPLAAHAGELRCVVALFGLVGSLGIIGPAGLYTTGHQTMDYLCGPLCLTFCARWLGDDAQVEAMARLAGTDRLKGTSLAGLARAGRALGLEARHYRLRLSHLKRVTSRTPAIAHVDRNHFVVVWTDASGQVTVVQPPGRSDRMSLGEFGRRWNGALLVLSRPGGQPAWSVVPDTWVLCGAVLVGLVGSWLLTRSARASRVP